MSERKAFRVWTISNGLSFLRLVLSIPVVILAQNLSQNRWWIFAICWFVYATDLSDGFIARHFNQESEFGRMIDPVADKIFVSALAIALAAAGFLPLWFLAIIVLRDILILIGGIYLKNKTKHIVQSNYLGKAAVVTVGICLLATLFKDSIDVNLYLVALWSSALTLFISFIGYGNRFVKLLRTKNVNT